MARQKTQGNGGNYGKLRAPGFVKGVATTQFLQIPPSENTPMGCALQKGNTSEEVSFPS